MSKLTNAIKARGERVLSRAPTQPGHPAPQLGSTHSEPVLHLGTAMSALSAVSLSASASSAGSVSGSSVASGPAPGSPSMTRVGTMPHSPRPAAGPGDLISTPTRSASAHLHKISVSYSVHT